MSLVAAIGDAVRQSLAELRANITDVKYGAIVRSEDCITFRFNDVHYAGVLRDRNADLILTGDPKIDAGIAARTMLDGHAKPVAEIN